MFSFFNKKSGEFKVVSPAEGLLVSLDRVGDKVFSEKTMGDGVISNDTSFEKNK